MQELADLAVFAHELADLAAAQTVARFRAPLTVRTKGATGFDPVTEADVQAERKLRARIQSCFPAHGIIGEECGVHQPGARTRWVLDPIDGTRSFICGVPTWTTLIALEHDAKPVLGIIDQPYLDERWCGTPSETRLRHRTASVRAQVSECTRIQDARVSTTDPRTVGPLDRTQAAAFARLARMCRVARFSLDGYAYALLAAGHLDLVIEAGLAYHDYAALAPVVWGAGGVLSSWSGGPFSAETGGTLIAASTRELYAAARAELCAEP